MYFENCIHFLYTVGMSNIQYTIRNVPEDLDKLLRLRAKKSGESFNKTLLKSLISSTQQAKSSHSDLDWFYGSGGIGQEELSVFADQRTIDKAAWAKK